MKLGTHNGTFHADDVFAYAILAELYEDVELTRSRDAEVLAGLDIVFDVGRGEFDHHTNDKVYRPSGIPYAATGLIWKSYGRDLIRKLSPQVSEETIERVFQALDDNLLSSIDAIDNGVTIKTSLPLPGVSDFVRWFNPNWDSDEDEDLAFQSSAVLARSILRKAVDYHLAIQRARDLVVAAYHNRRIPEILVLEKNCPWLESLLEIDSEAEVLFVIYPGKHQDYRIQTVRTSIETFENRKSLPSAWAGLEFEALGSIIGIDDAIFCHPARFLAVAGSLESVLKMAELAIQA